MSENIDFARLRKALADARSAFPPEFSLRRIENLPLLRVWDQLNQFESLVARLAQANATTRTVPLRRRVHDDGTD